MSGSPPGSTPAHALPLGLRREAADRPPNRSRRRRPADAPRVWHAACESVSDQEGRPGRRVRRERLPLDRSRQHLGLQLPLRRGNEPLVGARVRARDRRQSHREPVRVRRAHVTPREHSVSRSKPKTARDGARGRSPRARVRCRSGGAGEVAGRPCRTTSTSPRADARDGSGQALLHELSRTADPGSAAPASR